MGDRCRVKTPGGVRISRVAPHSSPTRRTCARPLAWGVTRFMDVAGVKAGDDNKTIDEYERAQKALRAKGKPRWYDAGNWDGDCKGEF